MCVNVCVCVCVCVCVLGREVRTSAILLFSIAVSIFSTLVFLFPLFGFLFPSFFSPFVSFFLFSFFGLSFIFTFLSSCHSVTCPFVPAMLGAFSVRVFPPCISTLFSPLYVLQPFPSAHVFPSLSLFFFSVLCILNCSTFLFLLCYACYPCHSAHVRSVVFFSCYAVLVELFSISFSRAAHVFPSFRPLLYCVRCSSVQHSVSCHSAHVKLINLSFSGQLRMIVCCIFLFFLSCCAC